MNGTRCHVEQDQPSSEKQISYVFSYMQNIDLTNNNIHVCKREVVGGREKGKGDVE
jgi:hypothetical protein